MRKVWVVVANSTSATVYKSENGSKIVEHQKFNHTEGHLADRELTSDKRGRSTQRGVYGTDTMQDTTTPHAKEAMLFAHEIALFLEKGFTSKEFERLYIIAKAPFLGHLRQELNPNTAKLVEAEINKDLHDLSPEKLREYLPLVL